MRACIKIYLVFLLFNCNSRQSNTDNFQLTLDGMPNATIIISKAPSPAAQLAALELQHHVKIISGAKLPIMISGQDIKGNKIHIGDTEYTKQIGLEAEDEEIAWKYIGTDQAMNELEKYINQAIELELTPEEEKRVRSWERGLWDYMKIGKQEYLSKIK